MRLWTEMTTQVSLAAGPSSLLSTVVPSTISGSGSDEVDLSRRFHARPHNDAFSLTMIRRT